MRPLPTYFRGSALLLQVAFFIFSMMISCKPPTGGEDNDTKTIDNYSRDADTADYALNYCSSEGGNDFQKDAKINTFTAGDIPRVKSSKTIDQYLSELDGKIEFVGDVKNQGAIKAAIKDVFRVVPLAYLHLFFKENLMLDNLVYNNKIYVYANADASPCKGADDLGASVEGEIQRGACYTANKNQQGVNISPALIRLSADSEPVSLDQEQSVRHGLLNSILFYGMAFNLLPSEDPGIQEGQWNLKARIYAFTKALRADMSNNGISEDELPGNLEEESEENFKVGLQVLGHVLDSMHCSVETRNIVTSCFPNVHSIFSTPSDADKVKEFRYDLSVDPDTCKSVRSQSLRSMRAKLKI